MKKLIKLFNNITYSDVLIIAGIFCLGSLLRKAFGAEEESLIKTGDVRTLFETVVSLPKLGTTGIILFIVAVVTAFGIWWWWNSYSKKITHKKNEKQRVKDQAEGKTENQEISDDWNEAHDRVEDIRKSGQGGKNPLPPKPGGE